MSAIQQKRGVGTEPLNWLEVAVQQVESLQFGIVEIVVHDRRVVQIERTEKIRFDKPGNE